MRNNKIKIAEKVINSEVFKTMPNKVKKAYKNWVDLNFVHVGLSYLGSTIKKKTDDRLNEHFVRRQLKITKILLA